MKVLLAVCLLTMVALSVIAFASLFKVSPIGSFTFSVMFGIVFSAWLGNELFNR